MAGVAIGGFMGAGKTTVGRALAAALGLPFIDTDQVLVERHGSIEAQFAANGEAAFRDREASLVGEICAGPDAVIATGGGVWASQQCRVALRTRFASIVLTVPLDVSTRRVAGEDGRPLASNLKDLFEARREAYSLADHVLDVGDRTVGQAVAMALRALDLAPTASKTVRVDLGRRSYDVVVDPGGWGGLHDALRSALPRVRRAVVVSDTTVAPLWHGPVSAALDAAGVEHCLLTMPAGESHKTVVTWADLMSRAIAAGADRRTIVVALGGGVVGDMAGFLAAALLRGVPYVQLPTTLLSMVDSSVGGKTGFNHAGGKNLVGAFHQPSLVYGGMMSLGTLPAEELRSGFGEVLKTALVGDMDLLSLLEAGASELVRGVPSHTAEVIARCVEAKAAIVARDEHEGGLRMLLNAGHTVGHAYEMVSGTLRHGEAVVLGLISEAQWAVAAGLCEDSSLPAKIADIASSLGLDTSPPRVDPARLVAAMQLDKKAAGDTMAVPVPVRAGKYEVVRIPRADLCSLLTL